MRPVIWSNPLPASGFAVLVIALLIAQAAANTLQWSVTLEISNMGFRIQVNASEPTTFAIQSRVQLSSSSTAPIDLRDGGTLQSGRFKYFPVQSGYVYNGRQIFLSLIHLQGNSTVYNATFTLPCTCRDNFFVKHPQQGTVFNDGRPYGYRLVQDFGDLIEYWRDDSLCTRGFEITVLYVRFEDRTSSNVDYIYSLYDNFAERDFPRSVALEDIVNSPSPITPYIYTSVATVPKDANKGCGAPYSHRHSYIGLFDVGDVPFFLIKSRSTFGATGMSVVPGIYSEVLTDWFAPSVSTLAPTLFTLRPTTSVAIGTTLAPVPMFEESKSIFQLFTNDTLPFNEANRACGQQVSSGNTGQFSFFRSYVELNGTFDKLAKVAPDLKLVWIGLRMRPFPYLEYDPWIGGSPVLVSAWAPGQPDYNNECVAMDVRDRNWKTLPCDTNLPFLCKFDVTNAPTPKPTMSPTGSPTLFVSALGFKSISGRAFRLIDDAKAACEAYMINGKKGRLAIIRNANELNHVRGLLGNGNIHWVSMQRAYFGGPFRWIDWSSMDVVNANWSPGQPDRRRSSNGQFEDCVVYDQIGRFSDILCDLGSGSAQNKALCRFEDDQLPTSTSEFELLRLPKAMNFEQARSFCQARSRFRVNLNVTVMGQLATFQYLNELNVVRRLAEKTVALIWLGARRSAMETPLSEWIDGSSFNFTAFDPYAAATISSSLGCLVLNEALYFQEVSCEKTLEFVACEYPQPRVQSTSMSTASASIAGGVIGGLCFAGLVAGMVFVRRVRHKAQFRGKEVRHPERFAPPPPVDFEINPTRYQEVPRAELIEVPYAVSADPPPFARTLDLS
jgi:hypothetical protein